MQKLMIFIIIVLQIFKDIIHQISALQLSIPCSSWQIQLPQTQIKMPLVLQN